MLKSILTLKGVTIVVPPSAIKQRQRDTPFSAVASFATLQLLAEQTTGL